MNQTPCMTADQCSLLHDINVLSFFVTDMTLFLDTHPDNQHAADYIAHYQKVLCEAKKEYARKYAPLSKNEIETFGKTWSWSCMPLPWDGGCD